MLVKFSLTKILAPDWNPNFSLSNFLFKLNFFFQNCLAVLSMDKVDNSCFLQLNHTITAFNIKCIDFNINLIENVNNVLF